MAVSGSGVGPWPHPDGYRALSSRLCTKATLRCFLFFFPSQADQSLLVKILLSPIGRGEAYDGF
jgi:hypothetical protein